MKESAPRPDDLRSASERWAEENPELLEPKTPPVVRREVPDGTTESEVYAQEEKARQDGLVMREILQGMNEQKSQAVYDSLIAAGRSPEDLKELAIKTIRQAGENLLRSATGVLRSHPEVSGPYKTFVTDIPETARIYGIPSNEIPAFTLETWEKMAKPK